MVGPMLGAVPALTDERDRGTREASLRAAQQGQGVAPVLHPL